MKTFIFLIALMTAFTAQAVERTSTALCTYSYKSDMWSADLVLSLRTEDGRVTLWMQTPTPYGIRPYGYDVKTVTCNSDQSLHVETSDPNNYEHLVFDSKESNSAGRLEYFNDKNESTRLLTLKCDAVAITSICNKN